MRPKVRWLWSLGRSKEFEGPKKVAKDRDFWRRILRETVAVALLMIMMIIA